jgi:hypothetical protein
VFRLRTIRHWYLGYIYIYHVKSADGLYQKIRCMVYCKKKKKKEGPHILNTILTKKIGDDLISIYYVLLY